jgi:hypothetical protein
MIPQVMKAGILISIVSHGRENAFVIVQVALKEKSSIVSDDRFKAGRCALKNLTRQGCRVEPTRTYSRRVFQCTPPCFEALTEGTTVLLLKGRDLSCTRFYYGLDLDF